MTEAGSVVLQPPVAPRRPAGVDTTFLTPPSGARVRAGTLVQPDTVEIGDPFTFIVTVAVPANARVEWPTISDSAAVVAMREPVRVVDEGTKVATRRERAVYTLSAWDVGPQSLNMPDAVVHYGSTSMRVPLGDARVFVRSVLPGDSTQHIPKPARDLFPRVLPWWQQWWPALLVLAALGLLWWLWKRRRRAAATRTVVSALNPFARAMHEFDRLERLGLANVGEAGRYVALAVDVMRLYLAMRAPTAGLSLTSGELLDVLHDDARIPRDRLQSLLADVDGIKFAARTVSPSRARDLAASAKAIVEHVEQVEQARRAAAEAAQRAAAAAATAAAAREKQVTEDTARRASRKPRGPKSGAGV